jgi:rhomboid family GlyGly-CTERM serine protease
MVLRCDFKCDAREAPRPTSHEIRSSLKLELIAFALILIIANAVLFGGVWREQLVFFPGAVASGQWWRVLTHPFVHVSWYHLLLDGAAFLMLYAETSHWRARERLMAVAACGAGSLAAAMTNPAIVSLGFCGLSGVAHGLMAVSAVEMIRGGERRVGCCVLALVVSKALVEAVTGNVALSFLHFGMMGTPIAACHAGGVVGGLLLMLLRSRRAATPSPSAIPESASSPA